MLAPRDAGVFLQLVHAVDRRRVGRRGERGAKAETVEAAPSREQVRDRLFVEPAAGKDADVRKPALIKDRADLF